jgi:hypothetical protein
MRMGVGMQVPPLGNCADGLLAAGLASGEQGQHERSGIAWHVLCGGQGSRQYLQQGGVLRLVHRVPPNVFGDLFGMIPHEPDFDLVVQPR